MDSDDIYYCCHCIDEGEGFASAKEIADHYRDIHPKYKKKCKICLNRFHRDRDLTKHKHGSHGEMASEDVISCLACKENHFPSMKALSTHYDKVHPKLTEECRVCKNRFSTDAELKVHQREA